MDYDKLKQWDNGFRAGYNFAISELILELTSRELRPDWWDTAYPEESVEQWLKNKKEPF